MLCRPYRLTSMVHKDALFTDKLFNERVPAIEHGGRWFITFGNAGFNSPANNRDGYATKASALKAIKRYDAKGRAHRAAREAAGRLTSY